ncbi:MAG: DUF454 domain-containing protein [Halieaceae bacterium]|nr:DUF454 domain-containing protein [Halieaceae bacterium]
MKKIIYKTLGLLFLIIGAIGLALPVLPTTPFVLLAAWCFARSSEYWHEKLLNSELFGASIKNWESHRCISATTKLFAAVTMIIAGSASIVFAMQTPVPRVATAVLMLIGACTVISLKTCSGCENDDMEP